MATPRVKLDIKSNIKSFSKGLDAIGKRQIPYVTQNTMNQTLYRLKEITQQTMGKYIDKPKKFSTKVFYQGMKNKRALPVGYLYFPVLQSTWLKYSIFGGSRPAKKGRVIPVGSAKRDAFGGVPQHRQILKKSRNSTKRFIGKAGIFERVKGSKPKLLYAFEKQAMKYKKTFPFFERMNLITPKIWDAIFKKNFDKAVKITMDKIKSGALKI